MKKLTFLFMSLFISLGLFAVPLPAGNYYVPNDPGSGATYYSDLTAAFTAINDNGIDGDINLYINGNITQTTNVGLINTSEHTITIRPDADADRTITFGQTADNAGPSGALIIGIKMGRAWTDLTPTKNIVIDGYAEVGNTRRLKIATSVDQNHTNGPIVLINDCSNITIKNTIIEHVGPASGSSSAYGIYLRTNTLYGTGKMPSDVLIENNHITVNKLGAYQGIATYANAAPTVAATGVKIKDNVIIARTRGIFLNYVNGIEITGNEINVKQTNASTLSSGIMGNSGMAGDIIVRGNKFKELNSYNSTAGDWGMKGILASGGGTWYIDNNFFSGLEKGFGAGETKLNYIRTGSTCFIRNNTFYMKSLSFKPAANIESPTDGQSQYAAISIAAGTPEIKNNIFVSNESTVYNHFIRGTNGGDSNNNIFYFDGANTFTRINSTHSTLAAYQAANSGKDVDSKFVEVNFANAATGDLSIAGASINDANLAVPRLATVLKDIFGTDRATTTYAGAHEAYFTKTFTVTVPSGTEHVYVAGSFSDKNWDISNPHELIATGNPNEYSGSFPCVDGVEYKYLNGKANWDYGEAKLDGEDLVIWEGKPAASAINRSYNAADVVKYWVASPKVNLTVTISENSGEPSDLFVKGGWNGWTDAVALSKQSEKVFTGSIGNGTSDVIYSNTEYKYLTSQLGPDNWEQRNDNRWMIYPAMNDEISKFETEIPFTTVENIKSDIKIMRTSTGISVELDGNANSIELYNMKGVLMERAQASGSYTRDLESGAYILRINGVGHKFVR